MAPTVVLLHAFPLDKRMWDDVVDPLAAADWDVVVPDLRGFGGSAYGEDGPDDDPSLVLMARDVLGILDRLGVNSAVVVGLSLGGYVAMEMLRQDASRIAGLALVDTKASADGDEARANRLRVADQVLAAGSTTALARAMLPSLLGETTHRSSPGIVAQVRSWIEDADPAAVAWTQRAMAQRPDSHEALAALVVPSLVVWGEQDQLSGRTEQESMVAALRDVRLVTIPDVGHLSAVEDPPAVAAALVDYLGTLRRSPATS